ncbi:MAG: hypothetical protein J6Y54_08310 [Lentisphaeria bacterium]|nr:hypothetical protein [Lentisphaeria bacterium]
MDRNEVKRIEAALQAAFPATDIEWRVQQGGVSQSGKPWARVLAYVTNRAIQSRLDEVFGVDGWQNMIREWRDKSTVCGISVRFGDEWITKWDGADETDIEATKGGISDAMKRAAVQWGIGRYLYKLEATFAECTLEKQTGPEWHAAKYDRDKYLYWKTPTLPAWALPTSGTTTPPRQPAPPPQKPAPQQKSVDKVSALLTYMAAFKTTKEDIEKAFGYKVEEFKDVDFDMVRETVKLMKAHPQWTFADAWAETKVGA